MKSLLQIKTPYKTIVAALALAYAFPAVAAENNAQAAEPAEPQEATMQEVAVTATRSEKAVEKIPGAVSIVSKKDLGPQLLIAEDPSQALATFVPGYAPSRQKLTQFGESLRGRTALILFDGIPQSNPLRNGAREGYFADPAVIERIEVISGASAIQGLGATGGIINYISKTPKKLGTKHTVDGKLTTQFKDDSLTWKTGYTLEHKNEKFDALVYVGRTKRGMAYDADGRLIGMDAAQGDTMDSKADDVFLKMGTDFDQQRVQFSYNRFKLEGDGDYRTVNGNRAAGLTTTSERGTPPGTPPRNEVETASVDWRHADIAGGLLSAQVYKQNFSALYGAGIFQNFQDVTIAPTGTLVDQSEIVADKKGMRVTYLRPDLFVQGLELTTGLDWLNDNSRQHLAATGRTWVPPLDFTSTAPFAQLEYELGPVTVRGGLRREKARLDVDTYTTLAVYGSRNVEGGTLRFSETVKNLGAIWRLPAGWSVFASYNEGFGLPDVGLVLRAVNTSGSSVERLLDLKPVVTENKEVGFAWRGARGSVAVSYYDSRSDLGSQIRVDRNTGIGHVDRVPVVVKGWELTADMKLNKQWSAFTTYSQVDGKTATATGAPLDVSLGARSQGPDKLVAGVNWIFSDRGAARLQAARFMSRHINEGRTVGTTNLEENFDGYTVADLAISYKTAWGDLGLGIENLFDRQYIAYYAQSQTTQDSYFAGRGRTMTVSYSRSF
ncbi:TonB-dependent receptor [Noviherbaspirillum agri]